MRHWVYRPVLFPRVLEFSLQFSDLEKNNKKQAQVEFNEVIHQESSVSEFSAVINGIIKCFF